MAVLICHLLDEAIADTKVSTEKMLNLVAWEFFNQNFYNYFIS